MKTIIEPFRTKMVEPIKFTTQTERKRLLKEAGYNLFKIKAEDVIVDLLTDSGTSAMSAEQWAAIMRGDESYAGCASFFRLEQKVRFVFGFNQVIPVHQGRAAERIFFSCLVKPGDIVPSNAHFDTTRANVLAAGGQPVDLPISESEDFSSDYPFKGNIDIDALKLLIKENGSERIPFGMLTISNNSCGGQPVSLSNIQAYSETLAQWGIPLYIDAARFAENAYLIKQRESGYSERTICSIVKEIFNHAHGCLMSAKKDGLANIGGFIALRDEKLALRLKDELILTEGFPTYGGLSGRDLEAIAVGLGEVLSEDYLRYRETTTRYLAEGLISGGIPIMTPPGMHAVYIDAKRFFPHIVPSEFPGQALVCQLYLEGGIRACEIGTAMFGGKDPISGEDRIAKHELVRLALPRRVYSKSHYDYVIEAVQNLWSKRKAVSGMKITFQAATLRHFTAKFEPLFPDGKSDWPKADKREATPVGSLGASGGNRQERASSPVS